MFIFEGVTSGSLGSSWRWGVKVYIPLTIHPNTGGVTFAGIVHLGFIPLFKY
jgi:hypothetical protein